METRRHLIVVAFLKEPRAPGYHIALISGPKRGAQALIAEVYQEGTFAVDVPVREGARGVRVRHPSLFLMHGWLNVPAATNDSEEIPREPGSRR